jgi:hypothetical protein
MCELNPSSATARQVFEAYGYDLVPLCSVEDSLRGTSDLVVCTSPDRDGLKLVTSLPSPSAGGVTVVRVPLGMLSQADSVWGGISAAGARVRILQAGQVGSERSA